MQVAARLLRGMPGLSYPEIRALSALRLRMLFRELPKLEAQERIAEVQVAGYAHWSGGKSDPHAGDRARKSFMATLQAQAFGRQANYTSRGERILASAADFRRWLGEWGIDSR